MPAPAAPLSPVLAPWYAAPPDQTADRCATWITRGANFVVALSRLEANAVLEREANEDEYVLLCEGAGATVSAGPESIDAQPGSLTIVPPGASRIVARSAGTFIRIFSSLASDILAAASNKSDYADGAPLVAPLASWPEPIGGYRLRHYVVAEHGAPGSIMRIFRTRNLMVNVIVPWDEPRDIHRLSPHAHADFEQGSLALSSRWLHHLRLPWTPDMTVWRDDLHAEIGSPSLTIIPPTVIHTSHNVEPNGRLVDIFAPPRLDFSRQPGLVINEAEYPMPENS